MSKPKKRFWMSFWYTGDDYRPLHYPPNVAIIGWWCSGEREDAFSLCLLVDADSEDAAKQAVCIDWPEATDADWRFVNEVAVDHVPGCRFPLSDWMKKRIGK